MVSSIVVRKSPRAGWKCPFSTGELQELLYSMLRAAGRENARCELALLDDAAMTRLNASAAHCHGPTNILAFSAAEAPLSSGVVGSSLAADGSLPDDERFLPGGDGSSSLAVAGSFSSLSLPDSTSLLGSLALSVDTLRRECFLYDQDVEEHCIRLLAHGLAHLLGFDHGPAMSALTDTLEAAARTRLQRYSHE